MRLALLLAAPALLACTELDALQGSAPALPWSPVAPRLLMSSGDGEPYSAAVRLDGGALELTTDLPRATAD
ncbi:MAG TPA: hypothetical protein VNO33_05030, partial [Kofleriaceae bacterium]|nr:hypothetical protein [Kofleriaceae bacterium]